MKGKDKIEKALRDPTTEVVPVTLTPEKKNALVRICNEMIDELKKRTEGPFEAYMVLHFMMDALESHYDIRGGIITEGKKVDPS